MRPQGFCYITVPREKRGNRSVGISFCIFGFGRMQNLAFLTRIGSLVLDATDDKDMGAQRDVQGIRIGSIMAWFYL